MISAAPRVEESPAPPPAKVASLALSLAEIFSLEEFLFAAMGAAAVSGDGGEDDARFPTISNAGSNPHDKEDHQSQHG